MPKTLKNSETAFSKKTSLVNFLRLSHNFHIFESIRRRTTSPKKFELNLVKIERKQQKRQWKITCEFSPKGTSIQYTMNCSQMIKEYLIQPSNHASEFLAFFPFKAEGKITGSKLYLRSVRSLVLKRHKMLGKGPQLSDTLPLVQPRLASRDTNIHTKSKIECKTDKPNRMGNKYRWRDLNQRPPRTKALIPCQVTNYAKALAIRKWA